MTKIHSMQSFGLIVIYAVLIMASGSAGDSAGKGKKQSPPSPPPIDVDCDDIEASLNDLADYLSGGDSSFLGSVTTPDDGEDYDDARTQYATSSRPTFPSVIVQVTSETDVRAAVIVAASCDHSVSVRSGGHSYWGISSCDALAAGKKECMQINVHDMKNVQVMGNGEAKKLRVQAGVSLVDLTDVMVSEGVFIPTGECTDIGVSGHTQTGGFGVWSRAFGSMAHWVNSFNVVLADGSIHKQVSAPSASTSKLNDELFYAVLGGAAGSFGVVTEVTFDTIADNDYHTFFWKVNVLLSATTLPSAYSLPGVTNMLRTWSDMVRTPKMQADARWSTHWSAVASQTLIGIATGGAAGFNYLQLDVAWVSPKSNGMTRSEALQEADDFVNSILDACTACLVLGRDVPVPDPAFESIFGSEDQGTMPELHRDASLFDFDSFGLHPFPANFSWQQGSIIPDADGMQEIVESFYEFMPTADEPRFATSQWSTSPTIPNPDQSRSLPWQGDLFGIAFDAWDFAGRKGFHEDFLLEFQEKVRRIFGDEDHRMFWGAYGEPNLAKREDWTKYYESEDQYNRLVDIKTLVDPGNLFYNNMSLPVRKLGEGGDGGGKKQSKGGAKKSKKGTS
uniref:FAD-binding PCMH-type domain-containing protein n=1 Tax=Entomoneis paludosa TaxID=265537 RepID=A0A7S2VE00_9STRA|mmetsp:Transcript_17996/g.37195  ORF Transcript_17996/g.37195 Transcript_17996/m.37195 type:complete len:620 (+) Transcript_17996:465-2324(+)